MTATLSLDRQTVTLQGPTWSQVVPVGAIAAQLRFYRGLWGRGSRGKGQPGPHARHYAPTIAALEAVAREAVS